MGAVAVVDGAARSVRGAGGAGARPRRLPAQGGRQEDGVVPIFMPLPRVRRLVHRALTAGGAYAARGRLPRRHAAPRDQGGGRRASSTPPRTRPPPGRRAAHLPRPGVAGALHRLGLRGEALPPPTTTMDSLACVVYSSGTTGAPKAITCPHRGSVLLTTRAWAAPYEETGGARRAASSSCGRCFGLAAARRSSSSRADHRPEAARGPAREEKVTRMPLRLRSSRPLGRPRSTSRRSALRRLLPRHHPLRRGRDGGAVPRPRHDAAGHEAAEPLLHLREHGVSMIDLAVAPEPAVVLLWAPIPSVEVLIMSDANNVEKHAGSGRAEGEKGYRGAFGMEARSSSPADARASISCDRTNAKRCCSGELPVAPQTPGPDVGNPKLTTGSTTRATGPAPPRRHAGDPRRHDSAEDPGLPVEPGGRNRVAQCATVPWRCASSAVGAEGTDKHIVAFVVSTPPAKRILGTRGARQVKAVLPHYMVPSFVVPMEELIMTQSPASWTRLSRRPCRTCSTSPRRSEWASSRRRTPSRPHETEALWPSHGRRFWNCPRPWSTESFFDMGGHSLRATKLSPCSMRARASTSRSRRSSNGRRSAASRRSSRRRQGDEGMTLLAAVQKELDAFDAKAPEGFDIALRAYWHGVSWRPAWTRSRTSRRHRRAPS